VIIEDHFNMSIYDTNQIESTANLSTENSCLAPIVHTADQIQPNGELPSFNTYKR